MCERALYEIIIILSSIGIVASDDWNRHILGHPISSFRFSSGYIC